MPLPSYLQLPACSESPSPVGGGEGGPLPYLTSAQCPAIATHLAGPTYVGPQVGFGCDAIFGIEVMAQAACLPLSKVLGWVGPPEAGGQALRASATPPPAGCTVNWDGSPGSACLYSGWWDLPGPPPIKSQGRATTHSVPRCAASQQHMLARPPPPLWLANCQELQEGSRYIPQVLETLFYLTGISLESPTWGDRSGVSILHGKGGWLKTYSLHKQLCSLSKMSSCSLLSPALSLPLPGTKSHNPV